jgi:DHA3 family macrolide efflux protein-like MFS transporter
VLLIDLGTAALGLLALGLTLVPQPAAHAVTTQRGSFGSELRAGLRYVLAWPGLLAILIMAAVINMLLTSAGSLLPILVTKHL